MPGGRLPVPGAVPGEPVPVDEPTFAANLQVLHHGGKLKLFRIKAPSITPRQPEVAPDERCLRRQVDDGPLIISAAGEGIAGPGRTTRTAPGPTLDLPLLSGEAVQAG